MLVRAAFAAALAISVKSAASATDYQFTLSDVVTVAQNTDGVGIYANVGDPIAFSLLVRDRLPGVTYTSSSAAGGPDDGGGTPFAVDRTIAIDPMLGFGNLFTPLEDGLMPGADYSASVTKDQDSKSLAISTNDSNDTPADPYCVDHCGGVTVTNST